MEDDGIVTANHTPSYLIECLVWNVPNEYLSHDSLTDDIRAILAYLFNNTINDADCEKWGEINELKYLFRSSQPWTREQAHSFLSAAWDYIGFE